MKLIKPKFWDTKNFISFILYPLSAITYLINIIKKLSNKKKFEIKTICIGNIYVGGTAKTPLTIKISQILSKLNIKNATIKNLLLNPGDAIPIHYMPVDVTFFILEGTGKITIADTTFSVKPQDIVICPINVAMSVKADDSSALSFLNIKTPGI